MVHLHFGAEATKSSTRLTIKVEINVAETSPFHAPITRPLTIDSQWWNGHAEVPTFAIEELMATKLRALYQRRKGRDVFDLWYVLTSLSPTPGEIVEGFQHCMGDAAFTYPELAPTCRRNYEIVILDPICITSQSTRQSAIALRLLPIS